MFDISPDHAIALYTGLLAIPPALFLLKVRRDGRAAPGTVLAASVLMAVAGAIHLALVWTHLGEPVTAGLFVLNGVSYLVLSQLYAWRWWRIASAGFVTMTLLGYLGFILLGFDSPHPVALATKLIELTTLGLVLVADPGDAGQPQPHSRCT